MDKYLSPAALYDIQRITNYYIEQDNIQSAIYFKQALYDTLETLMIHPKAGQVRADLTSLPVRFFLIRWGYFAIYKHESNDIEIVRVLHGKQDITNLLHVIDDQ